MPANIQNKGDTTLMRGTVEQYSHIEYLPTDKTCIECGASLSDEVAVGTQGSRVRNCRSCGRAQPDAS